MKPYYYTMIAYHDGQGAYQEAQALTWGDGTYYVLTGHHTTPITLTLTRNQIIADEL